MWQILQLKNVDDFILATGELHSVEQLVASAFECLKLNWRDYVRHDAALLTSVEPVAPCGNPSKAKRQLGWQNTVPFKEMVARLVESEMKKLT
jgi:GDPmannose 4,6-dehydratase